MEILDSEIRSRVFIQDNGGQNNICGNPVLGYTMGGCIITAVV